MPKAVWKNAVLAEAPRERVELIEGNVYFPPDTVRWEHLRPSETRTFCGWKGTASYHDVVVAGAINRDAAWYYPEPKDAAKRVAGFIAFWRGVQVEQ